jgi:hypothetical protein
VYLKILIGRIYLLNTMRFFSCFIILVTASLYSFSSQSIDVCLITIHPNSAHHFAQFAQELDKAQISWQILAAGHAEAILRQKKIAHKKISIWLNKKELTNLSTEEQVSIAKLTAKECKKAKMIIADISEPFIVYVQHELNRISSAKRYLYYDNPEPYVPGEYSRCFHALLNTRPDGVIFANYHLAYDTLFGEHHEPLECSHLDKIGLGFYPLEDAQKLKALKKNKELLRNKLFEELGIRDEKQKILLYLGGANSSYFEEAFPFFLTALEESARDPFFENILFLLQQHPRAKEESLDLYTLFAKALPFQVFQSPFSALEAIACSDLTYYYQTSMIPPIILGGCPLLQVSAIPFEDLGVRLNLVDSVHEITTLPMMSVRAIAKAHTEVSLKIVEEGVGYQEDWPKNLVLFVRKHI